MRKPLVLLIDDNDANLELYREMAEMEGCGVSCVCHPDQVEQALAAQIPDLILLDLTLPGRSGFVVAGEILARGTQIILAITAQQRPTLRQELEQAGFSGLISKPCGMDSFIEALHWGLNGAQGGFKVFS